MKKSQKNVEILRNFEVTWMKFGKNLQKSKNNLIVKC